MSLICIEGVLGVGKTTLVQRCAERLPCVPFYEEVENNPFLPDFYHHPKQSAIHVQYTFLLLQERMFRAAVARAKGIKGEEHKRKQEIHLQGVANPPTVICDFHPFKSLIFSNVVLQPHERAPLTQLYHLFNIPQPDLVVYLRADEHTILARLRKRDDVYQAETDFTYISRVYSAYETFFRTYRGPCVTIDTTHIDYVSNPEEMSVLFQQIPLLFSSPVTQKK
jgi:deoxyguanosine kinase